MPAAYLTTPAGNFLFIGCFGTSSDLTDVYTLDVIKTRLQVEARKGQTHYAGLRDAFVKICWFLSILDANFFCLLSLL